MGKVRLTYRPTRNPEDAQPGFIEMDTVAEAFIALHKLNLGRGFQSGIEIRQEGKPLYDEKPERSLPKALARINALIGDGASLEQAAQQTAKENGH